jgi:membrane peptidoglycan carboxypeptidase
MLDAALQRHYSANPSERFFTGGGSHVFENFERYEDRQVPSVEDALTNSINLAFVRLMRDIRNYYTTKLAEEKSQDAPQSSVRQDSLRRFADKEGRTYLNRFYDSFRGRKPDEVLHLLAARAKGGPNRLAVLFRSLRPDAPVAELRKFLVKEAPKASAGDREVESLYEKSDPDRFSLVDRAFLARVHPLQLWLARYLQDNPGASRSEVVKESEDERQEAYSWLFKTKSARKQDVRIRIVSEEDAFGEVLKDWRKQGYPFDSLIPSLATVLGSSGDRPDALAHLMGIILSDGMELPTEEIEELHFAAGTPYETAMAISPAAPKRVIAPEIARTVRNLLTNVVSEGTATRLKGGFVTSSGEQLVVGGKTGTGDNRYKSFGAGNRLIEARAVDRTATFVFYIGDRFYGTVTAYVAGAEAANYHFSSALAVQLLRALTPQLQPLIDMPRPPELAAQPAPNKTGPITLVSGPADKVLLTLTPHTP